MKSNGFLLLFICLTLSSCQNPQIFPQREICTSLGASGSLCTDKRIKDAPQGCQMIEEHSYTCDDPSYLMSYECVSPQVSNEYRTICENLALENAKLKRQLRRCKNK